MDNCRPAQIKHRRHDRYMSLDMSSCRLDSGGSYLVSCWNSGLCVPQGFTIIPHFSSAAPTFLPVTPYILLSTFINTEKLEAY